MAHRGKTPASRRALYAVIGALTRAMDIYTNPPLQTPWCPPPTSTPPIQKRNRVSARFRRGRAVEQQLGVLGGRAAPGTVGMGDSAGPRVSLRRYPELPVWVVENHQEVSGWLP